MIVVVLIMTGISIAPIYHTKCERRELYDNTSNARTHAPTHARTHAHAHTHTHTHTFGRDDKHGCKKIQLKKSIKQVIFEDAFERARRIRLAECLRQTVPNSVTK